MCLHLLLLFYNKYKRGVTMLFEGLDRIKRSAVMTTIILIITGNILLILPEDLLPGFNYVIGFVLLVFSVVSVFHFLSGRKALIHYINLTIGLLCGLLGMVFLVFQDVFNQILVWLVCLLPVAVGLYGIYHAFLFARRSGRKGWWILIVLSFLLIAFGGFIFYNPWFDTTVARMRIVGGTLMYTAVVSALCLIWLWPVRNTGEGEKA